MASGGNGNPDDEGKNEVGQGVLCVRGRGSEGGAVYLAKYMLIPTFLLTCK